MSAILESETILPIRSSALPMSTGQLRGYFSWRTKLRRGVYERAPLSFAFVYMYELINGVGASSPLDAFIKLRTFAQEYAEIDERVVPYAGRWLFDLAVYHGLDPSLLESEFVFTNTDSAVDLCACTDDERIKSIYSDAAYYCKHAVSYKKYPEEARRAMLCVCHELAECRPYNEYDSALAYLSGKRLLTSLAPLIPKLRGQFAEFLKRD